MSLKGCEETISVSVGNTANWIRWLPWAGIAAAGVKMCCQDVAPRSEKWLGRSMTFSILHADSPSISPAGTALQGTNSNTKMWFVETQPQNHKAKWKRLGLELREDSWVVTQGQTGLQSLLIYHFTTSVSSSYPYYCRASAPISWLFSLLVGLLGVSQLQ